MDISELLMHLSKKELIYKRNVVKLWRLFKVFVCEPPRIYKMQYYICITPIAVIDIKTQF